MKQNLLYLFFIILFQFSFSQTVTLDTTFGTNGKVTNTSITSGQTIQLQSDGKIVSCYLADFSITGNVRLARFNSDGSIDTTFGTNGFVNSIVVNETGYINMMKIQPDGKILVTGCISSTGTANSSYLDFCTARFNADGTLDTDFGTNGYAVTGFENLSYDTGEAIKIQNDGKILVGGYSSQHYLSSSNSSTDFAVVRYFPNGTIDTSFGTNGKFTYNFGTHVVPFQGPYSSDFLTSIDINSFGKIILAGDTTVDETFEDFSKFGLICLDADGTLDTSFGSNGQKVIDFGQLGYMQNLKLTDDDKIIATGNHRYTTDGTNNFAKIVLVKLLANGNFDAGFGNNGIVLANRDSSNLIDLANDLNILPDGKIICFGTTPDPTVTMGNFLLIRFNTNGIIDTTFNGIGYKTVDFDNSDTYGFSFLIQPDGKFLCAGAIDFSIGCLARLDIGDLSATSFATQSFSVYPNPFSETITIESKALNLENATVELYDISGRKLSEYRMGTSNLTITIDKNLSKGNYLLKIISEGKTETIKIIKQ